MSCHSFARTLMDETGSCAGGRWRGLFQERKTDWRPTSASTNRYPPVRFDGISAACAISILSSARCEALANITDAANEPNISSSDLWRLTWSIPRLIEVALEEAERLVNQAQHVLWQELASDRRGGA